MDHFPRRCFEFISILLNRNPCMPLHMNKVPTNFLIILLHSRYCLYVSVYLFLLSIGFYNNNWFVELYAYKIFPIENSYSIPSTFERLSKTHLTCLQLFCLLPFTNLMWIEVYTNDYKRQQKQTKESFEQSKRRRSGRMYW